MIFMFDREEKVYMAAFLAAMVVTFFIFSGCAGQKNAQTEETETIPELVEIGDLSPVSFDIVEAVSFAGNFEPECITTHDALLAELDGVEPMEAVVPVECCVGEGIYESYIAIYSLEQPEPRLLAVEPSHDIHLDGGYIDILDVENDGIDEIVVVGGADGGLLPRDIGVLNLRDGSLVNRTPELACGTSYFFVDTDFDGVKEIISLTTSDTVGNSLPGGCQYFVIEIEDEGFSGEVLYCPDNREIEELLIHALADNPESVNLRNLGPFCDYLKSGGELPAEMANLKVETNR